MLDTVTREERQPRRLAPRKGLRLRSAPVAFVVHSAAFAWFAFVWCWHLTPAAAHLPGAQGFGWFVRYLTFYSYTLQVLLLGLATVEDVVRLTNRRQRVPRLSRAVDDLACALFALAHVVTIMFYTIQSATKSAVEGGHLQRPPWLDASVHSLNLVVAWADMLVSNSRSFSAASSRLSQGLISGYLAYLLLCRQRNGRFPYPFLNKLPFPSGFVAVTAAGLLLFASAFRLGRSLNRRLQHVSVEIEVTERDELRITATEVRAPRRRRWGRRAAAPAVAVGDAGAAAAAAASAVPVA